MSNSARISRFEAPSEIGGLLDAGLRKLADNQLRRLKAVRRALLFGLKADGLALPISDLRKGSCNRASAIYRGSFNLAGERFLRSEANIFARRDASAQWRASLNGFSWLADMHTSGKELSRVQSRALIGEWIARNKTTGLTSRFDMTCNSDILARRIINWTLYADFFLNNCPDPFAREFFASLSRQVRLAWRRSLSETDSLPRLQTAIAVAYASLGFSGLEGLRDKAFARLGQELDDQIFADGGHISRNPQVLRDLLADLVPLRITLEKAKLEVPAAFYNVLERMLPALRFFTYLDGGLAVFNGVNDTRPGLVRQILETDAVCGTPLTHAVHSGYVRLQQGTSMIMIDTGKPVMPTINNVSSAGVMAFEFCDGSSRLITNCGAIQYGNENWNAASRSTQAQSDVCLNDGPIGNILDGVLWRGLLGGPVVLAAPHIEIDQSSLKEGAVFVGRHDGYAKRYGVTHERQLFLSADGNDFRGADSFDIDATKKNNDEAIPFAIRFHLHPSVRATVSQDGASAMLLLPNKTGWRFSARGAQLKLDESVYLPEDGRVRKTVQLVLAGNVGAAPKVQWAFKRIEQRKAPRPKTAAKDTPQLF
jgi:uncharacterized heparinase superfamily protein